jgi:hypothetical protein
MGRHHLAVIPGIPAVVRADGQNVIPCEPKHELLRRRPGTHDRLQFEDVPARPAMASGLGFVALE